MNEKRNPKKTGRPRKNESEKLSEGLGFKCTEKEKEKIIKLAKQRSLSEYVRDKALSNRIKIVSKTDEKMLEKFHEIGLKINQIAKILNITKDPNEIKKFKKDLEEMIAELKEIHLAIQRN
jgi:hypothetical protein